MPTSVENNVRYCSRCGISLTDYASRELGVGPSCRGKSNHLYAKTIEANIPIAAALILGTLPTELPAEIVERWSALSKSFLGKMEKVQNANSDSFKMKLSGADFRNEISDLDWMLSYPLKSQIKDRFVKIVDALGYPSLAAVLSGDCSTTEAKVWFDDAAGRVFLTGKSCKAGFYAMRRIRGIALPRYRGDNAPYSAPAANVKEFLANVQRYWPLYEGNFEEIQSKAEVFSASIVPVMTPVTIAQPIIPAITGPVAQIKMRTRDFIVSFPWVRGASMYDMINALKAQIPGKMRSYNTADKTWVCEKSHFEAAKKVLGTVFENIDTIETGEETPSHLLYDGSRPVGQAQTRTNFSYPYRKTWSRR